MNPLLASFSNPLPESKCKQQREWWGDDFTQR